MVCCYVMVFVRVHSITAWFARRNSYVLVHVAMRGRVISCEHVITLSARSLRECVFAISSNCLNLPDGVSESFRRAAGTTGTQVFKYFIPAADRQLPDCPLLTPHLRSVNT